MSPSVRRTRHLVPIPREECRYATRAHTGHTGLIYPPIGQEKKRSVNQVNRYGMLFEQVAQLKDLSSNAKVVHAVLYQFQNPETGQCNPKQSLIARAAGLSIKVTHAAIAELKRWGLLRTSGTNRRLQYDLQPTPYRGLIKPEKEEKLSTTYPPQGVSHPNNLPPTGG